MQFPNELLSCNIYATLIPWLKHSTKKILIFCYKIFYLQWFKSEKKFVAHCDWVFFIYYKKKTWRQLDYIIIIA